MPKNSEIKEIRDACTVLSPLNRKRVYEVACALKFAEDKTVTAAGVSRTGDGDGGRGKTKRD